MRILILLFLSLFGFVTTIFAQEIKLSSKAEISVLTIGQGKSLNDAFGHNAFRIKDVPNGIDVVYGYGQYDFDTPNFYLKFARGKLNYLMSKHKFNDIFKFYKFQNRTIDEQVLNLNSGQKQRLYNYLINNYKPENSKYLYDFFYDNCATRIRDVTQIASYKEIRFNSAYKEENGKTFRELIHEHVGKNTWGSFGIDIALGSIIDREANTLEQMFLPKYIHSTFAVSKIDRNNDLVKKSRQLYKSTSNGYSGSFITSPFIAMSLLAAIILFITYKDYSNKKRTKWLDISLFAITGFAGILLLLLWFATDHGVTGYNYNLLWAFPLNVICFGQLLKEKFKNWFEGYLKFLLLMLCLMTLHWIIGVQIFALGLLPILIALLVRYFYILQFKKQ